MAERDGVREREGKVKSETYCGEVAGNRSTQI